MITDDKFCAFLDRLAVDVRGKNGIILNEWESGFLATYVGLPTGAFFFTDARRKAVDRMWRRHGADLNFPHPLDCVPQRPTIPNADLTGCEYLVRDDDQGGRLRRCNATATCREPGRLRYCDAHGEAVVQAMKRAGQTLRLVKFTPQAQQ